MKWELYISKYDIDYKTKRKIHLATYETFEEAHKKWVEFILEYPKHEGIIEIIYE